MLAMCDGTYILLVDSTGVLDDLIDDSYFTHQNYIGVKGFFTHEGDEFAGKRFYFLKIRCDVST